MNQISSTTLHYDLMYRLQTEISRHEVLFYVGLIGVIFVICSVIATYKSKNAEFLFLVYFTLFVGFGILVSSGYSGKSEYKNTQEYILQKEVMQTINLVEGNLNDYIQSKTTDNKNYNSVTHVLIINCQDKNSDQFNICVKDELFNHLKKKAKQS